MSELHGPAALPLGKQATHIHIIGGRETKIGPNTVASVGLKVRFLPSRSKEEGKLGKKVRLLWQTIRQNSLCDGS